MMASVKTGISNVQFIDLDFSPTQTGNTTFTVPGNLASTFHYGRRIQASDATTLYGTVISSTFTTNTGVTLRMDSGNLGASLTAVAVGFPSQANTSLPESTFRRKNMLINGQFDIWQRGAAFSFTAGGQNAITADRWGWNSNVSAGAFTVSRFERSANASNVPTLAQTGLFLTNAIGVSVSAVCSTLANGNFATILQTIEGFNWRQIAHKPTAISFWVNSNKTGTYCVSFTNAGADRSFVQDYSISSVSTWEKKTFIIPEAPTTGTWDYSTGGGLIVRFALASGGTFQATAGAWTSMNALATSSQVNFLQSAGNTIKFACLQLEEGSQANPVEPSDYEGELAKCTRYLKVYRVNETPPLGFFASISTSIYNFDFGQPMRIAPSLSVVGAMAGFNVVVPSTGGSISVNAIVANNTSYNRFIVQVQHTNAFSIQGATCYLSASAGSVFYFKSEL